MTSKRKIRANQENAKKSTGPRSTQGKQTSSQNAYKHGIWAKQLTIAEDEREDYEKLVGDLSALLKPEGPILQYYFDEIVVCMWRLRKLVAFENPQFRIWDRLTLRAGDDLAEATTESEHADIADVPTVSEYQDKLNYSNKRELKQCLSALNRLGELISRGEYLIDAEAQSLAERLGKDFIDSIRQYLPTAREVTVRGVGNLIKAKYKDPEKALKESLIETAGRQGRDPTPEEEQFTNDLLHPTTNPHRGFLSELVNGRIDKVKSLLQETSTKNRLSPPDLFLGLDLQLRYSAALKRDLRKAIDAYQLYQRLGRGKR